MGRRWVGLVTAFAAAAVIGPVASAGAAASSVAPGAPGAESYFDLARKDCVGTARNTSSKVWFTVADGALSDTYWPTVDATNVHSLQYIVTNGSTFTDVQQRDMTYRVLDDPTGMACTVIASDATHHYSIATTYIADPYRDAVLMRMQFRGPASDHVYLRLDPLAGGTGGGGSQNAGGNSAEVLGGPGGPVPVAFNTNTTTDATNRSYAVPTYEALEASTGFTDASVGYAGTASDGQTMLDSDHALTDYGSAPDGHVALTAELPSVGSRAVTLALGFGETQSAATQTASAAAGSPFVADKAVYERGWTRYDAGLNHPSASLGAGAAREYDESVNVVKASEDKTFPGAIAAGLGSPWGQAVPAGDATGGEPTYFGSYREVFARDLYEAASSLYVAGDVKTARAADLFLFDRQQLPSGQMPRNSLENGEAAPDTGGLQLDETAYPILMDWEFGLSGNRSLYLHHVVPAADFLVAHGPSDGVERWEEQSGYSPSTIAAEISGLNAAAAIATANGDSAHAAEYQATADYFARNVENWTVTTSGPYASRYFIRLSKTGDPNAAISYSLGNGSATFDQRSIVDAGFLDLVRLGILPADDPTVQASVGVIDSTIERSTPSGVSFYRYGTNDGQSDDGYGDCYQPSASSCTDPGQPWPTTDTGTGHLWPVLSGERGEYDVADGDSAGGSSLLTAMANMTSGQGLEPEQVWEDPNLAASPYGSDPTTASIGFVDGKPAGSASPLTWAQAQYARLALDLSAGRDLETPSIDTARYVTDGMPASVPLTITSPTATSGPISSSPVTVTGTSAAGATIVAEASPNAGGAAPVATTTADPSGDWSLKLPASLGQTIITVTATAGARATGYAQVTVDDTALPGTTVYSTTDPTGDDDGPGTYQYPTASDFAPGAFDLTSFSVSQTSSDVYLQVGIRNLASTFGSDFGAQLLDVYATDPSAGGSTSTASAYPGMNYALATPWTERLEAQGFAPVQWVSASGGSVGSAQLIVDQVGNTATLVVPRAQFGSVGSGWTFAVALAGQGSDPAFPVRGFTATPGAYTFGVCAAGGTSPICSVDPGSVPTVMDTITPPGVSQSDELDPTQHDPVTLAGVTVP